MYDYFSQQHHFAVVYMEQCVAFGCPIQCSDLQNCCSLIRLHYLFLTFEVDVQIVFLQGPCRPKSCQTFLS
jgi:hypothetical protein